MARTITIHHFEDEPELVEWLPGLMLDRIWMDHPEWIRDNGRYSEDPSAGIAEFALVTSGEELVIRHRVYSTKLSFDRDCHPQRGDLVLVDVMTIAKDGALTPEGLSLFQTAKGVVGLDGVYFITAYPGRIPVEVLRELHPEHVVSKPVDASALCDQLLRAVGLG